MKTHLCVKVLSCEDITAATHFCAAALLLVLLTAVVGLDGLGLDDYRGVATLAVL